MTSQHYHEYIFFRHLKHVRLHWKRNMIKLNSSYLRTNLSKLRLRVLSKAVLQIDPEANGLLILVFFHTSQILQSMQKNMQFFHNYGQMKVHFFSSALIHALLFVAFMSIPRQLKPAYILLVQPRSYLIACHFNSIAILWNCLHSEIA